MVANFGLVRISLSIGDTITEPGSKVTSHWHTGNARRIREKKQQVTEIVNDTYHDRLEPTSGDHLRVVQERARADQACDDSGQYAQKNLKAGLLGILVFLIQIFLS